MACDSGLLGSGEQGSEALGRAKAAIPPAVEEWMKYFGLEVCDLKYRQHTRRRKTMTVNDHPDTSSQSFSNKHSG